MGEDTLVMPEHDNDGGDNANGDGVLCTVQTSCWLVSVQKHTDCTATRAVLYEKTGAGTGTIIATATFVSDVATFDPAAPMPTGEDYYVVPDDSGSTFNRTYYTAGSPDPYPYNNNHITTTKSVAMLIAEFSDWIPSVKEITTTDEDPAAGTNIQINVDDAWKEVAAIKINVDDAWKEVSGAQVNVDDSWKEVF